MNKKIIIAIGVVLVMVAGVWLWYSGIWRKAVGEPEIVAPQKEEAFGATISDKSAVGNPAAKLPDANPFKADINPYTDAYINPFGQ